MSQTSASSPYILVLSALCVAINLIGGNLLDKIASALPVAFLLRRLPERLYRRVAI